MVIRSMLHPLNSNDGASWPVTSNMWETMHPNNLLKRKCKAKKSFATQEKLSVLPFLIVGFASCRCILLPQLVMED